MTIRIKVKQNQEDYLLEPQEKQKLYSYDINAIHSFMKRIRSRVVRASGTEMVDLGSIPGQVKPKTMKIGTDNHNS